MPDRRNVQMQWGEQLQWRQEVHRRYPEIWRLRLVRKRLPFILNQMKDGETVLEIGAFDRQLENRLHQFYPQVQYKSLDIDTTYFHDYSSIEEVRETFDVILLFEVIEHLRVEEGRKMVGEIHRLLNPGGRLVVSTPNVYTPGHYWKDVSHLTPYHHEELGGLLLSQHFEIVEMCRAFHESYVTFWKKAYLFLPLFRLLGIDFAKSIFVVARKVETG